MDELRTLISGSLERAERERGAIAKLMEPLFRMPQESEKAFKARIDSMIEARRQELFGD